MKKVLLLFCLFYFVSCSVSHLNSNSYGHLNPKLELRTVETSCGECQFGLPGNDCTLAVRFDDKAYFVEGTHIDSFGNAHGKDGFCNAIRKAEVQGTVKDSFFVVSYFRLLKDAEK